MQEHRRELRMEEKIDVAIKVLSSPDAPVLEGQVFPSYSEDISFSGMKLNVNNPIPTGSQLELEVKLHNSPDKYLMVANVVWTDLDENDDQAKSNGHGMGVILNIESNPKHDSWCSSIEDMETITKTRE